MLIMFQYWLTCRYTFAQNTTTVTGLVIDDNGNVLPGVTVTPKGKGTGVITNNEGKFVITIPNNTKLQFTYIGFDSKEVFTKWKDYECTAKAFIC